MTTTIINILIALFTTTGSPARDLCDIVDTETNVPLHCAPHYDAPVWDRPVCCGTDGCVVPLGSGACPTGRTPFHCELGVQSASGAVTCYFDVPEFCDMFPCELSITPRPQANLMCCHGGECWSTDSLAGDCMIDDLYWCDDGVSTENGVECFDSKKLT